MPAKSASQRRLMAAAEHGATFPKAEKLRQSMTHAQLHDFAVGSEKGKPQHVKTNKGTPSAKVVATPAPSSYAARLKARG